MTARGSSGPVSPAEIEAILHLARTPRPSLTGAVCALTILAGAVAGSARAAGPARAAGDPAAPWLTEITRDAGVEVRLPAGPYDALKVPDVMTAGAAFLDFDRDGDLDILLTNATGLFEDDGILSEPGVRLYRQGPSGRFADVTRESGLVHRGYGIGAGVGDFDNDGFPDIYFANYGADYLFRNRGDGTFEDVTETSGVRVDGWSCSTVFFDYDLDGFLDVFVTQYVRYDPGKSCTDGAGRPEFCGPRAFPPVPDVLLHNNGDGTFTDVSEPAGIRVDAAAGLGVISADFDLDGLQDIYVTNDSYANHLWINRGDGTFVDDAVILGAAVNEHGKPEAGMGVVAADFDNDGDLDLFMTHLRKESNTFYRNLGLGVGFEDATSLAGLGKASMPFTGFGTVALDLELDGDLDLLVGNGAVNRGTPIAGVEIGPPWSWLAEPNQIFLNEGGGRFRDGRAEGGAFTSRIEMTRGLAAGDVDGDGDLDLLVANSHSPSRLYRNDAPRRGHWLIVRATDPRLRRAALGATVTLHAGGRKFLGIITRATSYLSSRDPSAHFGLGEVSRADSIVVRWPDGREEVFPGTVADRVLELVRGHGETRD